MLEPFDGSCFHDLSSPKPNPFKLWGVAKRFARSITPFQWPALAESVAREAFRRVFQREPPGSASSSWDLRRILKRPEHSFLDCAHLRTHANEIDLTLDWNSSRRDLLVERGRWRTYDDDPDFAAWLDHLPPTHRRSYEYRWLPPDISRRGLVLLLSLPELVPMPEPLIRLYFKRQLWRPRTAAEGGMATVPAHLVALTCQRLLAYHCARHARFGQWHVIRLIRKLHGRDWRVDSPDVGASRFSMFLREPLFVGATLCEHWVQDWIPRIQRVLEDSTRCLATPQAAKSEVLRLLPNQLLVCAACRGCETREGTPIRPVEQALPPFSSSCRCSRLTWSSTKMVEMERILRVWALDIALHPSPGALFPVLELFERSRDLEISRIASPPGPSTWTLNARGEYVRAGTSPSSLGEPATP